MAGSYDNPEPESNYPISKAPKLQCVVFIAGTPSNICGKYSSFYNSLL